VELYPGLYEASPPAGCRLRRVVADGVLAGIDPIVTLEKQVLNMIGNLVYIKWLSCVAKRQSNTTQPSARLSSVLDGSDPSMGTDAASAA
jgi:hypothetical protein